MAKKSSTEKEMEKSQGSKKNKSDNKEGAGKSIENLQQYVKDSFSELKKVQWPTRRQVTGETIVVLITVIFLTLMVMLFDKIIHWLFSFIF